MNSVPVQPELFSQIDERGEELLDLEEWAALYLAELDLPRHERKDQRSPNELSQEELFALPTLDVAEVIKELVAEAEFLGRESILGTTAGDNL